MAASASRAASVENRGERENRSNGLGAGLIAFSAAVLATATMAILILPKAGIVAADITATAPARAAPH